MAKRILDEEMRFKIIINGNEAQKELLDLEKTTRDLTKTNKDLRAEKIKLRNEGKKGSDRYKELTREISKNSLTLRENKKRMEVLQKEIGITGLTMGQLQRKATILRLALRNAIPGGAAYKRYNTELKQVTARLNQLKNKARSTKLTLSSLAQGFNKYAVLGATVIASMAGIVFKLQQMIDYNGKLSDAQADVMKTTGMTKVEVDDLAKSFGVLQTRTSRINLLKIAEEGGRIGVVKEEIQDFVKVMNKAAVALGDSFPGGVEEVAAKLGKLKFLFKETKDLDVDLAYNAIGSAINELGANGVATEINIANFATRVGSLPAALKPSVSQALALGAAFEESGIEAQKSARAYNIFLKQASTNGDKFAKVMGVTTAEVEKMINNDPLEFFLQFADAIQGMSATDVSKTLKELGINADGANKVLGAASNNLGRFRELIDLSQKSLLAANSLTTEYNIKNNNLAATLGKVQKRLMGMFSSQTISEGLNNFLVWVGKFIGAVEDGDGKVTKWRNRFIALIKTLLILTTAIVSYKTAVKLATLWTSRATVGTASYNLIQKVTTITTYAQIVATELLKITYLVLTGQLGAARVAMIALSTAMEISPLGLILGALSAIAVAYYAFSENAEVAATKQSVLNDATKQANEQTAVTVNNLKEKLKAAQDETASMQERQDAVDELNRTVPEYNNNLTVESANTLDATNKLNSYIEAIKNAAREKFFKSLVDQKAEELAKAENSSLEDNIKWYEQLGNAILSVGSPMAGIRRNIETSIKNKSELIDLTEKELIQANDLYRAQVKLNNQGKDSQPKEGDQMVQGGITFIFKGGKWQKVKVFVPKDDDPVKTKDKRASDLEKLNKELLSLERKSQDDKLALMQEGFDKERIKEAINHQRKIQDLEKQLIAEAEFKKIDKEIGVARAKGDDGAVNFLTTQKEIWVAKNKELNTQIETEDKLHVVRLGTIKANADADYIKNLDTKFASESRARETAFKNELSEITSVEEAKKLLKESLSIDELANITTLQEGKEALQKKFKKEELEKQSVFLREMLQMFKDSLEGEGLIDITPYNAQQLEDFKEKIAQLEAIIANINIDLTKDDVEGDTSKKVEGEEGSTDILGMSNLQWKETFSNLDTLQGKFAAAAAIVGGLLSAWSIYHESVMAQENRSMAQFETNTNRRKDGLKAQLDSGEINRKQYDKRIAKLDKDFDKQKRELEYKQAKREHKNMMVKAIGSTAMAILNGLSTTPFMPLGIIMGALAGVLGGIQIAQVAKNKPVKGFETGLYPIQREQDGKIFDSEFGGDTRSGMVNKPTYFLAGENNKPEMIIDNNAFRKMNPDVRNSMIREVARVKGFESGLYPDTVKQQDYTESNSTQSASIDLFTVALNRNSDILERIEENGLLAVVSTKNMNNMKDLKEGLDDYNTLRDNNKI